MLRMTATACGSIVSIRVLLWHTCMLYAIAKIARWNNIRDIGYLYCFVGVPRCRGSTLQALQQFYCSAWSAVGRCRGHGEAVVSG